MSSVRELTTTEHIEEAEAASARGPVLIFKHSLTCGTSAMAEEEVLDFVESGQCPMPVYWVRIQAQRGVSNAIAARFGIRHESPQVLILRDGKVIWSATHYRVTKDTLEEKCRELVTSQTSTPG